MTILSADARDYRGGATPLAVPAVARQRDFAWRSARLSLEFSPLSVR